jgi:AraC-like DNA-binding protein
MKRATEVFSFQRRPVESPLVEQVWQTRSEPEESFISAAVSNWEIVVTRQGSTAQLTVLGPETSATAATIPEDATFFGIQFRLGTFMPRLPPGQLVDRALTLPAAGNTSFWLDGSRLEIPTPDHVDAFVAKLVRAGTLAHDPLVPAVMAGRAARLSARSIQRRVSRATGLTPGAIRQIKRAQAAVELLCDGVAPPDAAYRAGYSDQPHLTRSLKRFVGQTPAEIATSASAG